MLQIILHAVDTEKPKDIKGFSITLAFGRYAGIYAQFGTEFWRICLGWVAFMIWFHDFEAFINILRQKAKRKV